MMLIERRKISGPVKVRFYHGFLPVVTMRNAGGRKILPFIRTINARS